MITRRLSRLSIVLFSIAGLLVGYTVWAIVHCYRYITEAISAGQLVVNGNVYNVVNFYMSNCAQYALFAVIISALGFTLMRTKYHKDTINDQAISVSAVQTEADNELDELFEEMEFDK